MKLRLAGGGGAWSRPAALLACIGLLAALAAMAGPVRAASTDFGATSTSSKFGTGVTFTEHVGFAGTVRRVEILVSAPATIGPEVTEVPVGSASAADLRYTVDASQGAVLPNTPLSARWRVTYTDGRVDVGPAVEAVYADDRFPWRTKTAGIVRVHWYQGDDAFATRALSIAQQGIDQAANLLGVTETAPVDFFVYASQQAFYDAMGPGTRENVGGTAIAEIRTLFALITPDEISADWVGIVIPHELTHLVFDTATRNVYHESPRWLNEGLADYLSRGYNAEWRGLVQSAASTNDLMPLNALAGQFPTSADRFYLAYAESTSAIDFLIRRYGRPALVKLVRSYAGGVTDDEAFSAALGVDTAGFEAAWLADVGGTEPQRDGPQPAPSGPVPSDWLGSPGPGSLQASPGATSVGGAASASPGSAGIGGGTGSSGGGPSGLVLLAAVVIVVAVAGIGAIALYASRTQRGAQP